MNLKTRVGLAGVANFEVRRARLWGRFFAAGRIVVALWLGVQWHLGLRHDISFEYGVLANWLVWSYFIIEMTTLTVLVRQKWRYLYQNVTYILIILLGIPLLLQIPIFIEYYDRWRILLVLVLLVPWLETCRAALSDNRLGTTLLSGLFIILFAGVLISGIDPAIKTPWDGIWWAVVTVSTVGYGDVVPVTATGKVFAAIIIIIGLGLFAVITANFSAIFVRRGVNERMSREYKAIRKLMEEMNEVRIDENRIMEDLSDIRDRLQRIEDSVS